MVNPEEIAPVEQSDHKKAAAKHAKKRAYQQAYLASGKGKAKRKEPNKVISRSLEPRLASNGTNAAERKKIALFERAQRKADTRHSLARPSVLTPLQIKRMERTKSGRAYMEKIQAKHSLKPMEKDKSE